MVEALGEQAARLGALVRRFRHQAGLTQQEAAERAGMSVGGLRDLEQGRVERPRPATMRRLAAALDLPESAAAELDRMRLREPATGYGLWLGVLGPLTVTVWGEPVDPGSTGQSALLGLLALQANTPVSVDALADVVWGERPPPAAAELIQSRISRLRQRLRPPVRAAAPGTPRRRSAPPHTGAPPPAPPLIAMKGGYQLTVTDEQLDLLAFRRLVERARRAAGDGDHAAAYTGYQRAVTLRRGEPLADVAPLRSHPAVAALDREWRRAVIEYADTAASLGRHGAVVPLLRQVTETGPLDEPAHARLIAALAGGGEPAEALAVYERLRRRLAEELGVDPVPELRRLHQAILRGEPARTGPAPAVPAGPPVEPPAAGPAGPPAVAALARLDVPAQLPIEPPAFTGRQPELARLDAALEIAAQGRTPVVCVVSGSAGVGKTALVVHWGHRLRDRFPDGQLYLNLRGYGADGDAAASELDPDDAVRAFLDALAVPAERIPASPEAQAALYRSLLAGRRMLVVLDNARDAERVRPLLPGSPGCLVLVTSRDQLTGLVAAEGAHPVPVPLLSAAESRDLLACRLGADRTTAEPDAVDAIIERCAGLPLALAVVAARAIVDPGQPLEAFAAQLRDTASYLDTFDAGDPATTVRVVFSWSYRALTAPAGRLFRLLGLHPGPDVTVPAAASVAGVAGDTARGLLGELTRAHLIAAHAPDRYAFHDLLRAYAGELAHAAHTEDERRTAERRTLDHYLRTGRAAAVLLDQHHEPDEPLPPCPGVTTVELTDHQEALAWFTAEHRNLMAAVRHAESGGFDQYAPRFAHVMAQFLDRRGLWHDHVAVLRAALRAAERLADRTGQAEAHRHLGHAHMRVGRYGEARAHLGYALDHFTQAGDQVGQAHTHRYLAHLTDRQGQGEQALAHAERALALYRASGHQRGQADALNGVGWHLALLGDYERAVEYCRQALSLQQRLGDRNAEAGTWDSLGYAYHHLGRYAEAAECYRRAIAMNRDLGDRYDEATNLVQLGETLLATGEIEAARDEWRRALEILEALGHPDAERVRQKLAAQRT
ncbi:BTAD domain-containing putative transcriptional regulator [Phytohabitans kaempferiae]|uniref:BTAD domain-containing putative transcriptional regulator n=1 Tax=Phytohabitans kaempferiae TaxID=1620943 RepID=A0ABV6MAD6_9ACTN